MKTVVADVQYIWLCPYCGCQETSAIGVLPTVRTHFGKMYRIVPPRQLLSGAAQSHNKRSRKPVRRASGVR